MQAAHWLAEHCRNRGCSFGNQTGTGIPEYTGCLCCFTCNEAGSLITSRKERFSKSLCEVFVHAFCSSMPSHFFNCGVGGNACICGAQSSCSHFRPQQKEAFPQ